MCSRLDLLLLTLGSKLLRMIAKILSRAFQVRSRREAAAFSDPLRRRLILLATKDARCLTQFSDLVGRDLKCLHYHVTELRKLGLLVVAREQRRGGRPIKFYKAVAEEFFVAEDLAPTRRARLLEIELRQALSLLGDSSRAGVHYYLDNSAEPQMRVVGSLASDRGSGAEYWRVLRLARADVLRLNQQIERCLGTFHSRPAGKTKEFLVHFAIAPRSALRSQPRKRGNGHS